MEKLFYLLLLLSAKFDCYRQHDRRISSQRLYVNFNNQQVGKSYEKICSIGEIESKHILKKSVLALLAAGSYVLPFRRVSSVHAVEDKLCSNSLSHLVGPEGKSIYLIGTAHISEESASFVRSAISKLSPDVVMIELDVKRIGRIDNGATLEEIGFDLPEGVTLPSTQGSAKRESFSIVEGLKFIASIAGSWVQLAASSLLKQALSSFYQSIEKLGFVAGGEFAAAVEAGKSVGARILLGDRDVDITFDHLTSAISSTPVDRYNIEKYYESNLTGMKLVRFVGAFLSFTALTESQPN